MYGYKELIVVIMLGLSCFIVGALPYGRQGAMGQRNQCMANLRLLHRAMESYSGDHDGYIPAVVTRSRPLWKFWYDTVQEYASSPCDFYCPANPKAKAGLAITEGEKDLIPQIFDVESQSYGMNDYLSDSRQKIVLYRFAQLLQPEYTVLLGDSRTPFLRPTKWCWKDDYISRHEGAANFVMADGHVELMNQKNLGLVHEYQGWQVDRKRWNNLKKN